MKKDNEYSEELFISPLDEDCESHFEYFPDGSIRGITEKGKYTIELLGLNEYSLKDARKCQYASCESMRNKQLIYEYYIKPYDGKNEQFVDMIKYFYNKGFFDEFEYVK